jgi:chemotaxis protein histidine kinase CheA
MTVDPFSERLARVRQRFVSTLEGKISGACAAARSLQGTAPGAAAAVAETYRCIHGIVGVGPTVGFPTTGRAARNVEDVLRTAHSDKRGLTADEMSRLAQSLHALRETASRELQSFYSVMH